MSFAWGVEFRPFTARDQNSRASLANAGNIARMQFAHGETSIAT